MIHTKRYYRFIPVVLGIVLVSAGLVADYWWHYKLAPARHLADPVWRAKHSDAARWEEEQKDYRQLGSSPDLCFRGDRIGFYGDKGWFLWLAERIRNPGSFRHCGCTEYALALMANRHVASWAQWADANSDRSQEDWIREGFVEYGVEVGQPPGIDGTVHLLRLLGRKSWSFLYGRPQELNDPHAVPSYVHYNAYRWLRDSGFKPAKFVASNAAVATELEITAGLLRYSEWQAAFPGHEGLGVLTFGDSTDSSFEMQPKFSQPWVQVGVDACIVACMVGGIVLIWRFTKRKAGGKLTPSKGGHAVPPNS